MPELLSRFVILLIPISIAILLGWILSKTLVRIRRLGVAGIYLIGMGSTAIFEGSHSVAVGVAYAATTLLGIVLLVGDAGGRFGQRADE